MALTIKWTKIASRTFHKTVKYIEEEWSERSAKKFVNKVDSFLKLLQNHPQIGKIELEDQGIRGFMIAINELSSKSKNWIVEMPNAPYSKRYAFRLKKLSL